jgi:hypothetical protein
MKKTEEALAGHERRTPSGMKFLRAINGAAVAFLAMYAFSAGLQSTSQIVGTTQRRIAATVISSVLFVAFAVYLHLRKPSWIGFGGFVQQLTRPRLTHWLYFAGVLAFTWGPTIPWLMPNSQLDQSTALEIQREVGVLGEKARMADLLYSQM